ncbi:hypothetical protein GV832_21595 [Rhodobacteraceae bacterium CYK-10]|uniref:Uncharacterized protein n=1 Tax=Stagnihabitans tardus TaxID=2699202 RepID=A0AAE4YHC3_9RHOB|nr:hypothetical protein [Stagnihabitans tardus]
MVVFYQIAMTTAFGKRQVSHPAAGQNGLFHVFGGLRVDRSNPPPIQSGKQRLELRMAQQD